MGTQVQAKRLQTFPLFRIQRGSRKLYYGTYPLDREFLCPPIFFTLSAIFFSVYSGRVHELCVPLSCTSSSMSQRRRSSGRGLLCLVLVLATGAV